MADLTAWAEEIKSENLQPYAGGLTLRAGDGRAIFTLYFAHDQGLTEGECAQIIVNIGQVLADELGPR